MIRRLPSSFLTFPPSIDHSPEASPTGTIGERDRQKIPDQYKWDLTPLYPSLEAWQKEKKALIDQFAGIGPFRGTLSTSASRLRSCLDLITALVKDLSRLYSYASMLSDQDTRDSTSLAMVQEVSQISSTFSAEASFLEPEILKMDVATVEQFLKQDKQLSIYTHYLKDILRRKSHTGSEGEEKIIADAGLIADGPQNTYGIFSNADFPNPEIKLSDGTTVRLDKPAFSVYRASKNRDDRKNAFQAFFGRMHEYRRTYGTLLNSEVKKNMFYMKARRYESCLHAALDGSNIPVDVYRNLVDNVNKNLTTFHRYLNLRKRILGLKELHYHDLYAPLLDHVDLRLSAENYKAEHPKAFDEFEVITAGQ